MILNYLYHTVVSFYILELNNKSQRAKNINMNIIDKAIEELLPRFKGMTEHVTRNDREDFIAYCNSEMSCNIGRQVRTMFSLHEYNNPIVTEVRSKLGITGGIIPTEVSNYLIGLVYDILISKPTLAPEEMVNDIIDSVDMEIVDYIEVGGMKIPVVK